MDKRDHGELSLHRPFLAQLTAGIGQIHRAEIEKILGPGGGLCRRVAGADPPFETVIAAVESGGYIET
jgi:hypothetical protein